MLKGKKDHKVIETIIGKETVIEGKIKLPTSLRIDGKVYGDIECEGDVIIGKKGYVEPAIQAKNVIIAGEAKGEIKTSQKVHIHSCGVLSGNISSEGIIIDEGGVFNGNSSINIPTKKSKKNNVEPISKANQ
ncbi:polymer-forming cytoskeletal protein [Amphibacillus sp. MSJ-3]|uniref:bactofilin family protein n=1 Tax=Amphibacillus sp. MSJ-3 TaxID=2841505 RepID=UPI001C0EC973|nr:polymer-forming cytoskeletal protein [Amphibacillus sp. MSJ-3]MBU5593769.1 polymer-forming cytoskeletal protein [Amphibacillus sp. MSJ-3]